MNVRMLEQQKNAMECTWSSEDTVNTVDFS